MHEISNLNQFPIQSIQISDILLWSIVDMIESRRVNHRRRSAIVAATTRFKMEGEALRTFREGADHNPEAPSPRRSRVLTIGS